MNDEVEFALREVVVAIEHLIEVVDRDRTAYERVTDSLHHALLSLMKEIEVFDWEVLR